MSKVPKYLIVIATCAVLVILFIWGQSLIEFKDSVQESKFLLTFIKPLYEAVFGVGTLDDYTWRKMAHVIEYFVLGVFASLLTVLSQRFLWKRRFSLKITCLSIVISEALCVIVSVIDELIQATNSRHPMVSDVFLDCIGALAAVIITTTIFAIIWKNHEKA